MTLAANAERHPLGHEAGNEGHVARQPIELGNDDWAFLPAPGGQRCRQLRPPVEGVVR
jgi:hypothetical protein